MISKFLTAAALFLAASAAYCETHTIPVLGNESELRSAGAVLMNETPRSTLEAPGFAPAEIRAAFSGDKLLLRIAGVDFSAIGKRGIAIPVEGKPQNFLRSSGRIMISLLGEKSSVDLWEITFADQAFRATPEEMSARFSPEENALYVEIPRRFSGPGPWRLALSCQTLFFTTGEMVGRENTFRYPENGAWSIMQEGGETDGASPEITRFELTPAPGALDIDIQSTRRSEFRLILIDRDGKPAERIDNALFARRFATTLAGLPPGEYTLRAEVIGLNGQNTSAEKKCVVPPPPETAPGDWWLRAQGRHIVDSTGKPFRLVGMARCQYHAGYERTLYGPLSEEFRDFRRKGLNAVRIAFGNTREEKPKENLYAAGFEEYIDRYIDPEVQAAFAAGLYVVLDAHHITNTLEEAESRIPLWEAIARRYADEPRIAVYEIWNESYLLPTGLSPASAPALRELFKKTILAIRKHDRRHLVMVSDWNAGWGHATEPMWAPDQFRIDEPYRQVVFSKHMAKDHSNPGFFKSALDSVAMRWNVPLLIGEMELEPGLADAESLKRFIAEQEKENRNYSVLFWRPHLDEMIHADLWSAWAKRAASPVPFAVPLEPEEEKPQLTYLWPQPGAPVPPRMTEKAGVYQLLPELPQYGSSEIRLPEEFPAGRYRLKISVADTPAPFVSAGVYLGLKDSKHLSVAALSRSATPAKREMTRFFYTEQPFDRIHVKKLDKDQQPGIGITRIELQKR